MFESYSYNISDTGICHTPTSANGKAKIMKLPYPKSVYLPWLRMHIKEIGIGVEIEVDTYMCACPYAQIRTVFIMNITMT